LAITVEPFVLSTIENRKYPLYRYEQSRYIISEMDLPEMVKFALDASSNPWDIEATVLISEVASDTWSLTTLVPLAEI
jgi:hypothetical protein